MSDRNYTQPHGSPETIEFWDAAREGKFLIRHCNGCGRPHWYPRSMCPLCGSTDTVWIPASGAGTVYSYSVMRRVPVPYAIAYVTLDEGPTMMTNIVTTDLDGIAVGAKVKLALTPIEGDWTLPLFELDPAG